MTRRLFILSAALLASAALLLPQKSDDDAILRAMNDELERSRQLRVVGGGDDSPYFFSYGLTDQDSFHAAAILGSPVSISHQHSRVPEIEVRVGSYDFDDTGHIFSGFYTGTRYDTSFPLDDNYATLREAFWLSTDRAYKTALESMSRKRAALNAAAAQNDKLPDFSRIEPVKSLAKVSHKKYDESAWASRAAKLSQLLGTPDVLAGGVDLQILEGTTYMLTNEGTSLRYDDSLVWAFARAEGQAPDGMLVRDAVSFQALDLDKFASEADVRKELTGVANNIRALVHAPAGESFTGPTLFEPQAAAQLLAQLLGDNLRAPRKPLAEPGRNINNFVPSELETKIGSRILPDWVDIVDDPTQTAWQGKPLAGFYEFDLEGVRGKPVSVVEKGVLKSFLTTRQPIKNSAVSNGHARLGGGYGTRAAAISNLVVKTSQTESLASLKKKLIDMCRDRGKPYGMLVRKLDYPFSAGRAELQALAQSGQQSGGSVRPVSPPVLVYRIYPDGREELVRGLRFRGISTRTLRDLMAASQETALFDYVNNAAPLAMLGGGGYLAPTSVIAPALLFEEIEFELPQEQLPKLPVVPPPSSGASQ